MEAKTDKFWWIDFDQWVACPTSISPCPRLQSDVLDAVKGICSFLEQRTYKE